MFDFLNMAGNYDQRKVDRTEYEHGFISTAKVTDGDHLYETAVSDRRYARKSNGDTEQMVIVEAYDTMHDAQEGHDRWVRKMLCLTPPEGLKDCLNASVAQMGGVFGCDFDEEFVGYD